MIAIVCFSTACQRKLTTYTEIDYNKYLEKIEQKDTFALVIGSETCSACAMFKTTMETFIEKYQVEVFYIDTADMSNEDYSSLNSEINFDGTPTTIFIEEGNLTSYYNRIDGAGSLSSVESKFKENGYIN